MKKNLIIIIIILLSLLIMVIGYASFATEIDLLGNIEITGNWNIMITKVEAIKVSSGCDAGTPSFTDTEVTFDAKLLKPGDEITYEITIENQGNIDAILTDSLFETDLSNSANEISYTHTEPAQELKAGASTSFLISITYDKNTTEMPDIKTKKIIGYIEYAQK